MADDKIYGSTIGFIQFDVEEREYNDGIIRDATIRSIRTGDLLRISFFPDFEEIELERGDLIAVDGVVTEREVEVDGESRVYTNMTARRLVRWESFGTKAPEVVKKSGAKKTRKTF